MTTAGWSNWSGTVQCSPAEVAHPGSEAEVAKRLRAASDAGLTVRAVGSGHSHTGLVASRGVIVALDALSGVHEVDTAARQARIGAGSLLSSLGEPLLAHGLALQNMGDVDVQTLAGALGTGTHGTGRQLGGLATRVAALRLATAQGELLDCSPEENPEIFDVARVSLGALGIVTEVTLELVPDYRLHERVLREGPEECLARFDERALRHRHCEFFWMPAKDVAEVKILDATDAKPDPLPDHPYERIDHSFRVLPSAREIRFVEMEYALAAAAGPECFRELRALMQSRHPEVQWPVEYRTVAADDIPLSPACGRDTVTVSVHQGNELPYRDFFAAAEAVLRNHGGRPHWGKWHRSRAAELRGLYPRWEDFARVRAELDPKGTLLNEHLREVLGVDPR